MIVLFGISCFYFLVNKQNYKLLDKAFPWISIGIYTMASSILTTMARVGFGIEQSLESRYRPFSTYGILSLIYLLAIIAKHLKYKDINLSLFEKVIKKIILVSTVSFLMIYPANFSVGTNNIINVNRDRLYGKACLILINEIDDQECIEKYIYPDVVYLRKRVNEIDSIGYIQPALATSNILQNISRQNLLSIDYGQFDSLSRDENGHYTASGWSVLPKYNQPAHAIILAYQSKDNVDRAFALVRPEQERKDVVEALDNKKYFYSGWSKSFSLNLIPTDADVISAWAFDSNIGRAYKLNGVHQIEQ